MDSVGHDDRGPGSPFYKKWRAAHDEMAASGDRGAAVLGQAMLEEIIKDVIVATLQGGANHKKKLVGDSESPGSLGFADQCRLAHCLDLVSARGLSDLLTIGRIRNRFGHSTDSISFTTPRISDQCDALTTLHDDGANSAEILGISRGRDRYERCVTGLVISILGKAARLHRERAIEYARQAMKVRRRLVKRGIITGDETAFSPTAQDQAIPRPESPPSGEPHGEGPATPPAAPA